MQLLLGGGGYKSSSSMSTNAASDSFISSLLNFPTLEAEETLKSPIPTGENACIEEETPLKIWKSRYLLNSCFSYVHLMLHYWQKISILWESSDLPDLFMREKSLCQKSLRKESKCLEW